MRVGSTIFSARQPKQPSSANAAGGILQPSLGKQCYPVGPPNQKRPKEQTQRNKFRCPLAVTMCVTKILVSHAAGICESEIPSITSFVALIKDAAVP